MTDRPAARQRGSLPGLALVVGLLALLIADSRSTERGAVIAFFVAAGAVVLLVVLLVAGSALSGRVARLSRSASIKASSVRKPRNVAVLRPGGAAIVGDLDLEEPVLASRRTRRHHRSTPNSTFVQTVDELLAAAAWRSPGEQQTIETWLVALSGADAEERARILLAMGTPAATSPIEYELQKFRQAMYGATDEQRAYLRAVVRAREALR